MKKKFLFDKKNVIKIESWGSLDCISINNINRHSFDENEDLKKKMKLAWEE